MLACIIKYLEVDGADDVPYKYKRSVEKYIPLRYWLGYAVCVCLVISVIEEAQQDEWISLISHAAFVVTALHSYRQQRYEAALTLIVTGTSLVWHSSGKFQEVDSVFTSIAALCVAATTVLPPSSRRLPWCFSVLNGSDDSLCLSRLDVLLILYKIVGWSPTCRNR